MTDPYIYAIAALLPLTALMLVFQSNPYNAMIVRGILGAVAALVYAIWGAADVALTEALMGTLLAITLYAVAVRSSMVIKLGVIKTQAIEADSDRHFDESIDRLRTIFRKRYMRLELFPYEDPQTLHQALIDKEVHATISPESVEKRDRADNTNLEQVASDRIATRIQRLYEIMQTEMPSGTFLAYVIASTSDSMEPSK